MNAISEINGLFHEAYRTAYQNKLNTLKDRHEAHFVLDAEQRNGMENELLDGIVPKDANALLQIVTKIPDLFTERLPVAGLMDTSPCDLVRFNLMSRAKEGARAVAGEIETEAFAFITKDFLANIVDEAVTRLKPLIGGNKAELVASSASLRDFRMDGDEYSFRNLLSDAETLASLLYGVNIADRARALIEVVNYASSKRHVSDL